MFRFIKIMTLNKDLSKEEIFKTILKAMRCNYHLDDLHADDFIDDEDHHHNDISHEQLHIELEQFGDTVRWVECTEETIDSLPVGYFFKGVTNNGLMRSYQVIAKTTSGRSLWVPIDFSPIKMAILKEFDKEIHQFIEVSIDPIKDIGDVMEEECQPGHFYVVTDFNNNVIDDIYDDMSNFDDDDDEDAPLINSLRYCVKDEMGLSFISVGNLLYTNKFMEIFKDDFAKYGFIKNDNDESAE